jgi:MFS transporter, ACS family, glucarate transporter
MGARVGRFRWAMVLGLIGPITFVMSLDRTAMVVAAPVIQREFHFTLVQMSFLLTAFSWTYAGLQVPAGWLAERIGPRRSLFAANALWSVFTVATPLGFSFLSFSAIRFALGIGQSADWPSSVLAIKRWFPIAERAKANSVLLGALYLGPIVAAPVTTFVMLRFGWPVAFYAFGAVGIVLGLGWLWGFRDHPERHPMVGAAEAAHIATGQGGDAAKSAPGAFVRCLGSGQFWAVGVEYFFLVLIQSFYTTWLPTYLVIERHLSLKAMGIYASLPWVALFVMVFVTGQIADRILRATGSVWRARVPLAITGFVVSAAALIGASRSPGIGTMMALLCISLGAIGLTQVSIWSSTQDLGRAATGIVSGWTNFWGNAAGVAGPVLTAFLVRWTGSWSGALLGIAVAGAAGAVLWVFVHPERPLDLPLEGVPART